MSAPIFTVETLASGLKAIAKRAERANTVHTEEFRMNGAVTPQDYEWLGFVEGLNEAAIMACDTLKLVGMEPQDESCVDT